MLFGQKSVDRVFNGNGFVCIQRIKFKRILSLSSGGKDKEIGVGNADAFFFFVMPELSDREETADALDVLAGWGEGPGI